MMDLDVIIHDNWLDAAQGERLNQENHHLCGVLNDYEEGMWRYKKMASFFLNNLVLTALSEEERDSLKEKPYDAMINALKMLQPLRKENGEIDNRGGEVAEAVLYGIMKQYYNAIPVVPKIFYKQNNAMPAFGADSVHIVVRKDEKTGNEDYSVWLGEAKFYSTVNKAFTDAVQSLNAHIERHVVQRENRAIINGGSLKKYVNNESLYNQIINFLDLDINSYDEYKKRLHIPILVMYGCETTRSNIAYSEQYKLEIKKTMLKIANKYFCKQDNTLSEIYGYNTINFHLILLPCPDKVTLIENISKKVSAMLDSNQ